MADKLPWAKVWASWYTTDSHRLLSGLALLLGPWLIVAAKRSPVTGALLGPGHKPIPVEVIAREVRYPPQQVSDALQELIDCGTLARDANGWIYFPKFKRWQESPSAERVRRHRARVTVTPSVADTVTDPVTGPSDPLYSDPLKSDLSGGSPEGGTVLRLVADPEVLEPEIEPEAAKAPPGRAQDGPMAVSGASRDRLGLEGTKPLSSALPAEDFQRVGLVIDAYRTYHPKAFRQRPVVSSPEVQVILARLAEGHTVKELVDAIDAGHQKSRFHSGQNTSGATFLRLTTLLASSSAVSELLELADTTQDEIDRRKRDAKPSPARRNPAREAYERAELLAGTEEPQHPF